MKSKNLLKYGSDTNSQNGEDGIIGEIFERIGTTTRFCCEFGAWDGIFLSNCRKLVMEGWSSLMIEGVPERFQVLVRNYQDNKQVIAVNCFVDDKDNSLGRIIARNSIPQLDFLSVDIDGFDFEILECLDVRPRVICIEVNAGHSPSAQDRIPPAIAKDNVGQPLRLFVEQAKKMGYDLVCYNGNAFFVLSNIRQSSKLDSLTCEEAYAAYLDNLSIKARHWMYLVNLGLVFPNYKYHNPMLNRTRLGISALQACKLRLVAACPWIHRIAHKLKLTS